MRLQSPTKAARNLVKEPYSLVHLPTIFKKSYDSFDRVVLHKAPILNLSVRQNLRKFSFLRIGHLTTWQTM